MEVPLAKAIIMDEMRDEVDRVLCEELFVGGEAVADFEKAFADYIGVEHAVAVDSGTRALRVGLEALGIGPGDTVLTTAATFVATANAIEQNGADVELVDIEEDTYTIDLEHVQRVVDARDIDAVLPVHLYGYPVDIEALRNTVGDIPIVADACQAHGAFIDGHRVGSLADVAGFSFYPSKNMTVAGDGGMITTDDPQVAETARSLRDVGRDPETGEIVRRGYTGRLNTVQAAIGKIQLQHLDDWNARRRAIADRYRNALDSEDDLALPPRSGQRRRQAWYYFVVQTGQRALLRERLADRGVGTDINYETPVHRLPPYHSLGYGSGSFPIAETWARQNLSLPVHPQLNDDAVEYVIESVRDVLEEIKSDSE